MQFRALQLETHKQDCPGGSRRQVHAIHTSEYEQGEQNTYQTLSLYQAVLYHLPCTKSFNPYDNYSHHTDVDTKTERGQVTGLKSHRKCRNPLDLNSDSLIASHSLNHFATTNHNLRLVGALALSAFLTLMSYPQLCSMMWVLMLPTAQD